MDITVDIQPDCTATLKATVPADTTAARRSSLVSSYASQAKLPGFRPGKTPKSLVEKRFKKEIEADLLGGLFDEVCREALEQNKKLKVLNFGTPEHQIADNGDYTVTTSLIIVPEFELPEYKGIEVKVPSIDVTDDDIDKEISTISEQIAEYEPVDRPAQKDDVAIINFTTTTEGKPLTEAIGHPGGFLEGRDGHWMKVEDTDFIPGWASALEGMKAGESKDITVTLPESFPIAELRNKEVVFHTTVTEVREKQVPAIDDAFAGKVVPGKTLDELKELIKGHLAERKKQQAEEAKADQITDKLADLLDFNLPEVVIEREMSSILQQKFQQALYSGKPLDNVDQFLETARPEAREEAIRHLKVFFMLQEVAQAENIAVTDIELYNEIARQAQQSKKQLKSYIRELQRDGKIHGIRMSLLTAKVLDFLVNEAKVVADEQ